MARQLSILLVLLFLGASLSSLISHTDSSQDTSAFLAEEPSELQQGMDKILKSWPTTNGTHTTPFHAPSSLFDYGFPQLRPTYSLREDIPNRPLYLLHHVFLFYG